MTDVRGPDGRVVRFPDGTDQATIMRVMGEIYSGQQPTDGQQGSQGSVTDEGAVGSAVRSLANGATAGWADKAVAGLESVIPGIGNAGTQTVWQTGDWHHPLDSLANAYAHNRGVEQAQTAADEAAHPTVSMLGNVAGAIASPLNKIGAPVEGAGMLANAGRLALNGAAYGGAYGAGQSQADSYGGEAMDALKGAGEGIVGNIAGAGIAHVVGGALQGVNNAGARALAAAGIEMTPGQILGGGWKTAEDKLTSVPLLGDAIKAARSRGVESFNTERINSALAPIKQQLPQGIAGSEAINYGQNAIDDAYNEARRGMAFAKDSPFMDGLAKLRDRIVNGGAESLAPAYRDQFEDVVKNTIDRRLGPDGQMNGDALKTAISAIQKKAAAMSVGNNPADAQEYGSALKELAGLMDAASRRNPNTDPAAAELMDRANEAYRQWVLIQAAAKRQGGELGTFSPGQYDAAVKQGDRTVRNRAYSAGNAFGQPMSTNAVNVLGRNAPNSFTADRLMMAQLATGGALGLAGHEAGLSPEHTAELMALGAGGAALYSKTGNALAKKALLGSRGPVLTSIGKQLNAFAPRIGNAATGAVLGIQHATP